MDPAPTPGALVRIGELSRRVGVGEHTLRAWESRYGLLRPSRSPGGYRLYSAEDELRVRQMTRLLTSGLSAAQAAEAIRRVAAQAEPDSPQPATDGGGRLRQAVAELAAATDAFDGSAAHAVLDRLFVELAVPTVLRDVVLPFLREVGERWQRGEASVTQEHFASNLVRVRLAALAGGWGLGAGPSALLACPPGEQHDLPLMIFGITLHRLGWRVVYLGADTPGSDLRDAVEASRPAVVVLAATSAQRFEAIRDDLAALIAAVPVAIAGAGATTGFAASLGALLLAEDPVTAAQTVASRHIPR